MRLLIALLAGSLLLVSLSGVPLVEITDFNTPSVLNGSPVFLIRQGDDPSFSSPLLDDGAWQVIALPNEWKQLFPAYNGVCWYRMHLRIPATLPAFSLGISLGTIVDADELYLNGHLIGKSGTIDGKSISAYDKIRIYELPGSYLLPGADNVLALRIRGIFDYMNGPYSGDIRIDRYNTLLQSLHLREAFDLLFVVTYVVVGVYFLLFFLRRREDKANIYFALFSLGIAIYFFLRSQWKHVLDPPFFWMKKGEYLVLTWLIYLLMEFLLHYFRKKHNWLHYLFLGLCGLSSVLLLFFDSFVLWDKINLYLMMPSWSIGVVVGFYVLLSCFRQEMDARLMFFTLVILFLTLLNDIMVNNVIYKFIWLSRYGFFFFIVGIAIILSNRFVRLHNIVADLNVNLEKKVVQRTDELRQTVAQLEEAKGETDNILQNVQEGIFLLDRTFHIGRNYSRTLETILEQQELGGLLLPDLLREIIPDKLVLQVQDFLEILFTRKIPARRMQQLNPLGEIKVIFRRKGSNQEKYLNFAFSRVKTRETEVFVLATVRDITERKLLSRQVEEARESAERDSRLFINIIHLDPPLLQNFLKEARWEILHIEELLKKARFSPEVKGLLRSIYTAVHAIKGDAGMLDIIPLAEEAHVFEEKIKDFFNQEVIQPLDLIELPQGIHRIKEILELIDKLITKITAFKSSFGAVLTDREYIVESLKNLVNRVAARENKVVDLDCRDFTLPENHHLDSLALKKILVQLVKNCVTHGITSPAAREALGKTAEGKIMLQSEVVDGELVIKVSDDGGTLDPVRIRRAAQAARAHTASDLDAITDDKIVLLIFETGLSTKETATIDAGRGIGLDVVKESLKELGGRIALSYKAGKSTQFRLTLPLA